MTTNPEIPHPRIPARRNRWGFPDLGIGIGLRTVHYPHILEQKPDVDFFEVLSENYMDTGGRPVWVLDQVAERYPIVLHGVSMNIGSADPLDREHLGEAEGARRPHARSLGLGPSLLDRRGRPQHPRPAARCP